jgi:DNA-binding winged helix-turn-helix (wHTH) protein/Tol biopolymer transport system component
METKDLYEFGSFRADARRKTLNRNGQPVPLPAKAFDVLYALLQRPGQTVLKDELMKEVWPDTFVEEGNLTQMVSLLRKALGETDGGLSLIVTVPRQGYRFVGDLTAPAAGGVRTSVPTDQPAPAASIAEKRGLPAGMVTGILAVKPGLQTMWWICAAIAIVSGLSGWMIARFRFRETLTEPRLFRYTIASPENTTYRAGKVSPDGRALALIGVDSSGKGRLWVRRLEALAAQPLAAAEFWPFWSPDSRYIAFAQDGKLKKIEASGGAPQTICNAALVIGGSWNRDGTILFGDGDVILRVPAKGGEATPLTKLDASRGETTHDFPVFLPDGRHFLYTIHSRKRENGGVYAGSLDSPDARIQLLDDISNADYATAMPSDSGYLLFVRNQVLMAQRFAAHELQLSGEAFPVVERIVQNPANLSASFSASVDGVLLVTSTYQGDQVAWFDRTGKRLGTIGKPGLHVNPQLSPDELTVAADDDDAERFSSDIWLFPVVPGTVSRLTFEGSSRAIWSPDGGSIAFDLSTALYSKTSAGAEKEILLLEAMSPPADDRRLLCEWSNDKRFLIYSQWDAKTGYDLWMLPLFGNRKPMSFLHAEYNEWCGTLSPDGKWIAYATDQSGRSEIYVQAFSADGTRSGRKWQVSDNGGHWPKWRRDGKELLYLGADRGIVGVEVKTGSSFQNGTPQRLFPSGIRTPDARFDVTADGRRFLIPAQITEANPAPATVIVNWTKGIKP